MIPDRQPILSTFHHFQKIGMPQSQTNSQFLFVIQALQFADSQIFTVQQLLYGPPQRATEFQHLPMRATAQYRIGSLDTDQQ